MYDTPNNFATFIYKGPNSSKQNCVKRLHAACRDYLWSGSRIRVRVKVGLRVGFKVRVRG
jgi:hypothetical protein